MWSGAGASEDERRTLFEKTVLFHRANLALIAAYHRRHVAHRVGNGNVVVRSRSTAAFSFIFYRTVRFLNYKPVTP